MYNIKFHFFDLKYISNFVFVHGKLNFRKIKSKIISYEAGKI